MNRHLVLRAALAVAAITPGVVLGAAGAATALSPLVPTSAVYALEGPDTPLPLEYTTAAEATSILVTAEGFVSSVECPSEFTTAVSFGTATITATAGGTIAGSTPIPCTVLLGLGEGAPASLTVGVSERDAFNVEVGAASQLVTLEEIDVTATVGDVTLTGGTYQAAEPRSIGDELTRSVTFDLLAARAISFTVPADTTMTGCVTETAATATCTMTRTLSLADLADGTAPVAPTMFVDGFPVSFPPADIDVPSERRLSVSAVATPELLRAGESVSIEAVVTNLGSVDLTGLVVSGAGIESALCDGADPSSLTLAYGTSVTCTATHLATVDDVDAVTPVVVRATPPFGSDSDLVDDDPTSSTDVDAVSITTPYSVTAAEIAASLSLGSSVAFVDDAGTDTLPMTLAVTSVGALQNAVVAVPEQPATGVTLTGCDSVDAGTCLVSIGAMSGGVAVERQLEVTIDPATLPVDGVDGLEIAGTLSADGSIAIDVTAAVVRTAAVAATVDGATIEASGATARFDVEIVVGAGHPVGITIVPSSTRPATLVGCTDGTSDVAVSDSVDGALLGAIDGGTTLTCTFEQAVVAGDRTNGTMPVEMTLAASAGAAAVERVVAADVPTMAVVLVPGAAPTPPIHGYGTTESTERPNSIEYGFEIELYGDPTAGGTSPVAATLGGGDVLACDPLTGDAPARMVCTGTHTVTVDDLAAGMYTAEIAVTVGGDDRGSATIEISVPFESLEVLLTELSTPAGAAGYAPGDVIRLLVQLRNRGTLPISLESLTSSFPAAQGLVESLGDCGVGGELAPGASLDCDVAVTVPSGFTGSSVTMTVVTAQFGTVAYTIDVAIDPTPVVAPEPEPEPVVPVTELPATGGTPMQLLPAALGLLLAGLVLRRTAARPDSV